MRIHPLSVPVLAMVALLGSARAFALGRIDFIALDAAVEERMAKHGLPGVALAVLEGGEIAFLKAYGKDGEGRPMTTRTRMIIGSQSKSFTALAIAQLAEDGKLDLGSPVSRYVPWFRVADDTASGAITIDHLIHHTSRLSDSGFGFVLMTNEGSQVDHFVSAPQLTDAVEDIVLVGVFFGRFYGNRFNPVTSFAYMPRPRTAGVSLVRHLLWDASHRMMEMPSSSHS